MDNAFWKSWPGVATITGVGVAVAAGLAWAVSKASGTSTGAPVTPGAPGASGHYYLFTLTTPYANSDAAGTPAGSAYGSVIAALTMGMGTATAPSGFTQLQVEEDPFTSNGWIGTGLWNGTGAPQIPAVNGQFTVLAVANGDTTSTTGLTDLGTSPPTGSVTYTSLTPGSWYTFTLETSFVSGVAPATAAAMAAVKSLAGQLGWSTGTGMLISPSGSNNQKWNLVAQWAGTAAFGTQPALPTSSPDRPPLVIYAPPVGAAGANPAPVLQSSQPTTVSNA
jgi:hypothetical protein